MIYISHRGNLNGPDPEKENHPDYILKACQLGFDVEIDVWKIGKDFFLGHDEPCYPVDWKFLTNPAFWCHAKNINALSALLNCGAHCFWHQNDDVALTSRAIMWTYPGKALTRMSVCVMPEKDNYKQDFSVSYGVCSDFIMRLKNER
jgi:hypothetical protein